MVRFTPHAARELVSLHHIKTQKETKRNGSTVLSDDLRRHEEIFQGLTRFLATIPQDDGLIVALESISYHPKLGGRASLLKLAEASGLIKGIIRSAGKTWYAYQPAHAKKLLCGERSASKEDVANALRRKYTNLDEHLQRLPKGYHEHITDAVGLAEAVIHDYEAELARSGPLLTATLTHRREATPVTGPSEPPPRPQVPRLPMSPV